MTNYDFGDIVLVPFPFTNQTATKKRPAVVVSSARYNERRPDLIIMAVTSQLKPTAGMGEFLLSHWQSAGLLKPSGVKPIISTVEKGLVLRRMGKLSPADQTALRESLAIIFG